MKVHRTWEPAFAGGDTFQKVPLVLDPEELQGADAVIVGAPMDDFVTNRPGARFGPREIRRGYDGGGDPEAYNMDLGIDPFEALTIVDHGDAEVVPGDGHASHRAIREIVSNVLEARAVPIILGGDHSIAYPDIDAVAERYETGKLGVVQFDAHTDTAAEIWGVERSHGTPFRHLVGDGIITGDRLVQVGLRGYWPNRDEFEWARRSGVRWRRMDEVVDRGIGAVTDEVLELVADAQAVFLSVDVDVLDPAFAPGTGTPEPGGMTARELLRSVRRIALTVDLAGLEVVEVAPPYDHSGITSIAAHRVVLEALSGVAVRKSGGSIRPENPL